MRLSSILVVFNLGLLRSSLLEVVLAQISSFGTFPGGGWVGGLVESRIRLISAEAEAEVWLGLAELGNELNRLVILDNGYSLCDTQNVGGILFFKCGTIRHRCCLKRIFIFFPQINFLVV